MIAAQKEHLEILAHILVEFHYIHFYTNTLGKGLIPSSYVLNSRTDWVRRFQPRKRTTLNLELYISIEKHILI